MYVCVRYRSIACFFFFAHGFSYVTHGTLVQRQRPQHLCHNHRLLLQQCHWPLHQYQCTSAAVSAQLEVVAILGSEHRTDAVLNGDIMSTKLFEEFPAQW